MYNTLVTHPEGCRISPQQHLGRGAPYSSDSMQSIHFPPAELIEYDRQRYVTRKLLGHLERGVLVRANQEGIFIKRLCQSRVFCCGLGDGSSQYGSMPWKLERDSVVKIFDTGRFFQGEPQCFKTSCELKSMVNILIPSQGCWRSDDTESNYFFPPSYMFQLYNSIRKVRLLFLIPQ